MTTKEKAKQIRTELKKANIKASVRMDNGCYSSAINVNLANLYDMKQAQAICKKYEKYERCDKSGEILSGGNTFVFVMFENTTYPNIA